ncbi:hypothetical protein OIU74_014982 [Salix koriyanagi]|uniref:Hydroxyproline-rich glycoprotein family protein n=1 Tax=Salix koriyanagi TaxID=2511006 RepID=A0A9Q0PX09_9ROSI|nr:hypothetical protein OIU74_014982 [Salix koriyanagi]
MADAAYHTKYQQQNQGNPTKYYTHFLYKALIVTIFLVILPLFPSQAPEFINQTLNTRGWEFLHLVFVGIAVSYGLFSRRNDETEKENSSCSNQAKFDNAQSYVSRFLQVSSVFDDDVDSPPKSGETKVQTWSNQYYRNDPVVVVAEQNSVLDEEQRVTSSRIGEKPLLLPVRSLKSRVIAADVDETGEESTGRSASIRRSNSTGSKRFSSNSSKYKSGEFGGWDYQGLEENLKENVVLPSPIPWRSRSGRMEMKEEADIPPSSEESEYNRSFNSQIPRSARTGSATSSPKLSPSPSFSSPKKFSASPSFSSEVQGKSAEDSVRKKSIYRSPPPPPPPPPPPMNRRSSTMKPSFSAIHDEAFLERELKRSFTTEPKDLNRGGNLTVPKSVKTSRSNDFLGEARKEKEFDDRITSKAEKRSKQVEASAMERTGRKTVGFDQSSFKTDRQNRHSVTFTPPSTFMEFPEEEKEEFVEKLAMESDEESETEEEGEDEDIAGNSFASGKATLPEKEAAADSSASDGGPDVDKKADEFIAKFREQIRLQRIESIKKSSAQIRRNPSR